MEYRIVDYLGRDGEWKNTDDGDLDPQQSDILRADQINVGFTDNDGEWHYRWIDGPFDEDFWIDDAIDEIADLYGIPVGA